MWPCSVVPSCGKVWPMILGFFRTSPDFFCSTSIAFYSPLLISLDVDVFGILERFRLNQADRSCRCRIVPPEVMPNWQVKHSRRLLALKLQWMRPVAQLSWQRWRGPRYHRNQQLKQTHWVIQKAMWNQMCGNSDSTFWVTCGEVRVSESLSLGKSQSNHETLSKYTNIKSLGLMLEKCRFYRHLVTAVQSQQMICVLFFDGRHSRNMFVAGI